MEAAPVKDEGYFYKQGTRRNDYKYRYFRIDGDQVMYYKNSLMPKKKGFFSVRDCNDACMVTLAENDPKAEHGRYVLQIKLTDDSAKMICLSTHEESMALRWCTAIKNAAKFEKRIFTDNSDKTKWVFRVDFRHMDTILSINKYFLPNIKEAKDMYNSVLKIVGKYWGICPVDRQNMLTWTESIEAKYSPNIISSNVFSLLQKYGRLPMKFVQWVAAELVDALCLLHEKTEYVLAQLLPWQITFNTEGQVAITTLDFVRITDYYRPLESPAFYYEYLSPEFLAGKKKGRYSIEDNWWSLGIILYEMTFGVPPFLNRDDIIALPNCDREEAIPFPEDWMHQGSTDELAMKQDFKDFLMLLLGSPSDRISFFLNGIREHKFFRRHGYEPHVFGTLLHSKSPWKTFIIELGEDTTEYDMSNQCRYDYYEHSKRIQK